jgi:transposase-like protein
MFNTVVMITTIDKPPKYIIEKEKKKMPKKYTPEEKAHVIARAAEIGAAAAAREAGVSYNGLLKWMHAGKESVKSGTELTGDLVEKIGAQIEAKEEEIKEIEAALKDRKAELKELLKAKAKAEKEKEMAKAAEEKKKLVEAVMNSGRSMEEILEFLNK